MKNISISIFTLLFLCCSSSEVLEIIKPKFTATINAGSGGTVSTPGGTYDAGTVLSITASAIEGYVFSGWTGSTETSNVINIILNTNITITANFELIEVSETQFTATINAGTGGIVSTSGGTLNEGTVISITATANDGYEFIGWTGSEEASNVISITLSADITLTANFQLIAQFTATINAGTGGIVSTSGGTLNEGTVLSITATANDGYEFIGWTGSEEASNIISITLSSDITLTANFQLIQAATNYYSSGELLSNNNISAWFDRSLDVYGIKLLVAGDVGGQTAVPDEWAKKVAQTLKLLMNKDAAGIDPVAQEKMIKILLGEEGWHQGYPTGQRIGHGGGNAYTPSPLTDEGISSYAGLQALGDSMSLDDMVWYQNVDSQFTGDDDIVELLEHVLHTLHRYGTRGAVQGSFNGLNMEAEDQDITNTEIYLAMIEAHTNGVFDVAGYGDITNRDKWPVMLKEYQYLLTFGMWGFGTEFWEGGSSAPEWNDNANTPEGIQENNPLGYALFNNYMAPVLSKPSINTLRSMFQDNDGGESGYQSD